MATGHWARVKSVLRDMGVSDVPERYVVQFMDGRFLARLGCSDGAVSDFGSFADFWTKAEAENLVRHIAGSRMLRIEYVRTQREERSVGDEQVPLIRHLARHNQQERQAA